jgi:hypothetical protein
MVYSVLSLGALSAVIASGADNNLIIIKNFGLRISHCGQLQMGSSDLSSSSRRRYSFRPCPKVISGQRLHWHCFAAAATKWMIGDLGG